MHVYNQTLETIQLLFLYSDAQLPKACTTEKYDGECCPVNEADEVCNGRGVCVDISNNDPWIAHCEGRNFATEMFECADRNKTYENKYCKTLNFLRRRPDTNETDFRYNWPARIFTRVCKCTGNWAGYDCSRCKRGYGGTNCAVKQDPVVRRSFLDLSPSEKNRIIEILNMSKYMESDFTVPLIERPNGTDSFKPLSLFDAFATIHYYSVRDFALKETVDKTIYSVPDFGHRGPGFLSWHRAYLLYFETELQHMLNDPSFALPYWDWTAYEELKARNNRECPDIFSEDLFGQNDMSCFDEVDSDVPGKPKEPRHKNGLPIITSKFNWTPVCTNLEYLTNEAILCNPYENDQVGDNVMDITRCVGSTLGETQCRTNGRLPTVSDVDRAISEPFYDICSYDDDDQTNGFRNALEGFYNFANEEIENCEGFAQTHNRVHLYIGGLMLRIPRSSNDPIFWLHHCNIDRLYEKWFETNTMNDHDISYKPTPNSNSVEYAVGFGHNGNDNAALLFPPITNDETHDRASEFGYSYQKPISCTIDTTSSQSPIITSTISKNIPTPTGTVGTKSISKNILTPTSTVSTTSNPGGSNASSSLHQSYVVNIIFMYIYIYIYIIKYDSTL